MSTIQKYKIRGQFKFGVPIDFDECDLNNAKLGTKGAWPRSRDLLLNFGTPSISLERLKIET